MTKSTNNSTSDVYKKMEKAGIDPVLLARKMNTLYFLVDNIEVLGHEIESVLKMCNGFRFSDKRDVNAIKRHSKSLIASVDKTLEDESKQIGFGELSEEVKELLDAYLSIKDSDLRGKALGLVKNIH